MNQFDGELAAMKHRRKMEKLHESPATDQLVDLSSTLGTVSTAGALIPGAAPAMTVVRGLTSIVGLFGKALKQGKPTVERTIDDLEAAFNSEIERVWRHFETHAERQQEFENRMQSQEAQTAMLSALFHALRTSDPDKHLRMAHLTVNCIFNGEMSAESLDAVMQATVQLTGADIALLGRICEFERGILERKNRNSTNMYGEVQSDWGKLVRAGVLNDTQQLAYRSSLTRLQSLGFIQQISASQFGIGHEPYMLLEEGLRFYDRVHGIVIK